MIYAITTGTTTRQAVATGTTARIHASGRSPQTQHPDAGEGLGGVQDEKHYTVSSAKKLLGKLRQGVDVGAGMNIIDGIDKDEQLKFEDPDWSTYWDDELNCWMMARHIYAHGDLGELVNIDWENAMSCEDYLSMVRQQNYLRQRYGTPKPSSIVDYWLAS